MAINQQKFREIVLQLLCSHNFHKYDIKDMLPLMQDKLKTSKTLILKAQERVLEILSKEKEIDKLINENSENYELNRIQNVEHNTLMLGIFELLYDDDIPSKVAIKEAIRLCRKFSTASSARFVNAILDKIYKTI